MAGVANANPHCRNVQRFSGHYSTHHGNFVEKIQFLAVEKDPYNVQVVGEEIRARQRAEAFKAEQAGLIGEVQSLRTELYELRKALTGGQGVVVPPPVAPAPAGEPTPAAPKPDAPVAPKPDVPLAPTPDPAPGMPLSNPTIKLSPWATNLLAESCAGCHNPNKASAGFVLFDKDLKTPIFTASRLLMVDQVLYSNEMPKAPKAKFTPEQYNKLRAEMDEHTDLLREYLKTSK